MPISATAFDALVAIDEARLAQRALEYLQARECGYSAQEVAAGLLGISNPYLAAIDPDIEDLMPQLQQVLERLAHQGVVLAKTVRDPVHGPVVYFRRR